MTFKLHQNFDDKPFVLDLPLCKVLMNDTLEFPWLFLIPMRQHIRQIHELTPEDQAQLMDEIRQCSLSMEALFKSDQLNVAAIGNMTPQLHVHIICRYKEDRHWPDVVWNKPMTSMDTLSMNKRVRDIQKAFVKSMVEKFTNYPKG